MPTSQWTLKSADAALIQNLSQETALDPLLVQILVTREINSTSAITQFMNPRFEDLLRAPELPDMEIALNTLDEAIQKQTPITVYGDFDMDGVNGTCVLTSGLKDLGAKVDFYIPHRNEGYSLTIPALDILKTRGTQIVITVDNGSSALEAVKYANSLGMQVMIADHHTVPPERPPCLAFINPKTMVPLQNISNISGSGIALMIVLKMFQRQNRADFAQMKKYFDLAAMGTVADLVPLLHENRIIATLGLAQLNERGRPGIDALLKISKFKRKVTSSTIGFTLGPRINAAGRLEHANLGVELLLSESLELAMEQAKNLNAVNTRRQQANETILKVAEEQIAQRYQFPRDQVIVIDHLDWHAGMIGITASHLMRKYHRPTVVIGAIGDSCRGSIRGLPGLDMTAALQDCHTLLTEFGGHKEAAGFSIEAKNIEAFRAAFIEAVNKQVSQKPIEQTLEIDAEILPEQITLELTEKLQQFQPFGKNNAVPVFMCKNLIAIEHQAVGDGTHLKATFAPSSQSNLRIAAIGFSLASKIDLLRNQNPVDVVFSLDINEWNGQRIAQMHLVDIRTAA